MRDRIIRKSMQKVVPKRGVQIKIIRHRVVMPRKQKGPFPNKTAASNYSAYQTFAATCEKQNMPVHEAVLGMADDPFWDMF